MRSIIIAFSAACLISTPALAGGNSQQQSSGEATSETTYKPLVDLNKNSSVGGYSNSTTTGGYTRNGSGNAIPDNTRGSTQDSSKGIMYEHRF